MSSRSRRVDDCVIAQKAAKNTTRTLLLATILYGCTTTSELSSNRLTARTAKPVVNARQCEGALTDPPEGFSEVDNKRLVESSLGAPGKGRLCQGKAYQVHGSPTIYRAFNSTHPPSRLGMWWALQKPAGSVSRYREKHEICYQWSPLDSLVRCKLREGATVVLGTGQSATCSEYLTYPASSVVQLYIGSAEADALQCTSYFGVFNWVPQP